MCALMGLNFTRPITAGFSMKEFAAWGEDNADGWGMAWYPDRSVAVIKEPVSWRSSSHSGFLENYHQLQSRLFLAHVRHRTVGNEPVHADTHPFTREWAGRDYCFAHNGTILNHRTDLPLGRFHPVGSTDSEHLFCHLLEQVAERNRPLDDESSWQWLHARLVAINQLGKLNCMLIDGERLFAYADANGFKGLAYCRVYMLGQGKHHFEDPTVKLDLEGEPFNQGYIVATKPLSAKGWTRAAPGELMVLFEGRVRFICRRDEPAVTAS